ncbi:Serine/threonine protein kinase [Handroanthus impetiginosus]|uniref:Serine/threonine protein kinase n=1 Tax=Handroanthus impetiginosus TaxID=429701 RepID=A0A2G9FZQ4_9LAMI|nr:Serine/threonine protein kinase [Handroanthus impetiginosus]
MAGSTLQSARLVLQTEITELKQLRNISFFDNQFTGATPQGLGINNSLTEADFTRNNFTDPISPNLCFRKQLTKLILGQNHLQGSVPSDVGSCFTLMRLILKQNNLTGMLPEFFKNSNPLFMDHSNNSLHGSIPSSLGNLANVTLVDFSLSKITCHIPPELGRLVELEELNLSHNRLEHIKLLRSLSELSTLELSANGGRVSASLFQLGKLSFLQHGGNQLGGLFLLRYLEAIGKLYFLTEVNVSYNAFASPVPLSLMNLPKGGGSCEGYSRFKFCIMPSRKGGLTCVGIAMIVFGSILFAVILVLEIFYVFSRLKRHECNFLVSAEEGASSLLHQVLEATKNLNNKYIRGRGAHGQRTRRKLTFVGYKGGNISMVREMQTTGKVRHRNLVKLEDFCLHDVLHDICPSPPLEWNVRYKIALGTARGLSYLHFDYDPPIIHRDIKPMDILLDLEMKPHILDLGITKLSDESVVSATSNVVQGTVGYMAPENAFSTKSSKESDVYACGFVLLELITRKKVLDPSFGGEMDIVAWVRSVWNETKDVEAIVDPTLIDEFIDSSIKEQVKDAILVALRCTEKEAGTRPWMREVVKQLTVSNSRCKNKKRT